MKQDRRDAAPKAFVKIYEARRCRSVKSVEEAIALLQKRGENVTLTSIVKAADELNTEPGVTERRTISHATILRNSACRALYDLAAAFPKRRARGKLNRKGELDLTVREAARARWLLRYSKSDLVALLIGRERDLESHVAATARLRDELLRIRNIK